MIYEMSTEAEEMREKVEQLRAERDEARDGAIVYRERAYTAEAEVERLRASIKRAQRPAARVVAAFDMFNDDPASPDTVWDLLLGQVEQLRKAIEGGDDD